MRDYLIVQRTDDVSPRQANQPGLAIPNVTAGLIDLSESQLTRKTLCHSRCLETCLGKGSQPQDILIGTPVRKIKYIYSISFSFWSFF